MAAPNKRKQQSITLAVKQSIIETSKIKPKTSELVRHFNNKYSESIILKDQDKILETISGGACGKRARLKNAKNPELEGRLLNWLKDVQIKTVAVDGPLLKTKTTKLAELAEVLGI